MKKLQTIVLIILLLIFVGLACKNNPLAKYTKQYHCTIEGEPEPQTSEEYVNRAKKHLSSIEDEGATDLANCYLGALNESLRLDPNNVDALRMRAVSYKKNKQYDLAFADFDKAIQIEPNSFSLFWLRSRAYEAKGSFDKAIEDQTTAINILLQANSPDEQQIIKEYERRADLFEKNADFDTAIKDYSEIIKLKPGSRFAFGQRAKAFEKKGDYESAVQDYTELIRIGDDPNNYYLRSEIYKKLGREDLAEADMKKFQDLNVAKNGKNTDESPKTSGSGKTISGGVLNGKAVDLPKPAYPAAARAVKASGAVSVQVTVDESGNVTEANAVSGHPLLRASAVTAARNAKFKPTLLSGKPVKVTGIIVYNFVP